VPLLTIGCLTEKGISLNKALFVSEEKAKELQRYRLKEGDLLFSRMASVGRAGLVPKALEGALFNYHIMRLRLDALRIDPRIFVNYVRGATQVRDYLKAVNHGATRDGINTEQLLSLPVAVPPLRMQREFIDELEKQFSRLDEAVANLMRAKANVKHYRSAVLKAAVEGHLVPTEAQLAGRSGRTYESGQQLLERISSARKNGGVSGKRRKVPVPPASADLPSLPDGWMWASIDQLAAPDANAITDGPFGSNLKSIHYVSSGPRVIRLQNIKDGEFADEYAHIAEDHFDGLRRHEIFGGDLAIASLGDNPPRACVIPKTVGPAIVKADCIRFKPHRALATGYLNAALNCQPTRARVKDVLHGIGRPRLSLGEIRSIALPIPPAAEQHRIASEIDRRLSIVRELNAEIEADLSRAQALRQSILAAAFTNPIRSQ